MTLGRRILASLERDFGKPGWPAAHVVNAILKSRENNTRDRISPLVS